MEGAPSQRRKRPKRCSGEASQERRQDLSPQHALLPLALCQPWQLSGPFQIQFNKKTNKQKRGKKTPNPTLAQAPPGLLLNHLAFCQSRQLSEFTDRLYYSRRDLAQGEKEKDEVAERSPVRQRVITSAHFLIAPQTHYLDKSLFWNWGQKLSCDWQPEQHLLETCQCICLLSASQINTQTLPAMS